MYHALPGLIPSGFVGVDIFFVISGYLIGGIIYSAVLEKRFSFGNFYARRARRILPALIVVVMAAFLAGIFLLDSKGFRELSSQSVGALIAIPNFYFWEHTSYFATAAEFQPLLMTWSLGVEEQFYIVFPFILLGIVRLPAKFRLLAIAGLTLLSFGYSILVQSADPSFAFYMLPPRAWELGAGATLAIAHHDGFFKPLAIATENLLAMLGAGLVMVSMFLVEGAFSIPGLAVYLSVFGTVLLVHFRDSWINTHLLSLKPVVFVGLVSYSWYLWHWPIISYLRIISDGAPGPWVLLAAAIASFFIAIASWRFVEQPFRRPVRSSLKTLMAAGVILVVALTGPVFGKLTGGWSDRLPEIVQTAEAIRLEGRGICLLKYAEFELHTGDECNPETATIALLGDSHASALGPGLRLFAESRETRVVQHTKSACRPLLGYTTSTLKRPGLDKACGRFLNYAIADILNDDSIETVVLAGEWRTMPGWDLRTFTAGQVGEIVEYPIALEQGIGDITDVFVSAGKEVIIVGSVPKFETDPMSRVIGDGLPLRQKLRTALTGINSKPEQLSRMLVPVDDDMGVTRILRDTALATSRATYMDIRAQLCTDDDMCRYAEAGKPVFFDKQHLSAFGSRSIMWAHVLSDFALTTRRSIDTSAPVVTENHHR